jgi:PTH1 family peptidyl-tRNA hydrolase
MSTDYDELMNEIRMHYIIAGLGNPGDEYARSRHNTGRMVVEAFREAHQLPSWEENKKLKALVATGEVGEQKVTLVLPETFMNNSGKAVGPLISSAKAAQHLVVVYDELDMPLGTMKISFARSSAGHRGTESIARAIKTKDFIRVRIGISPMTPTGKLRKPKGEEKVHDFILGAFSKKETDELKKVIEKAARAIGTIVTDGKERAMNEFN